jgi:hypothetical protein
LSEVVDYTIVDWSHAYRGQNEASYNEASYNVVESARAAYLKSSVGLAVKDFRQLLVSIRKMHHSDQFNIPELPKIHPQIVVREEHGLLALVPRN